MSTLQEDRNTTKADVYWLVGWTAVLLWDNIITISAAHRYLMKAKRTPMKGLYILNRYGTVIFQSLCMMMVVLAVPMNLCRSIFWFQCFALVYVITLLFMLAVEIGLLVGTVSQLRPLVLTPGASIILDFQGCVAVAASPVTRKLSIIFWSTTLAFNTIIFGLTMWKSTSITKRIGQHVTIYKRFLKAGILYYSVILASNLACVIFYSLQTKKPLQTFNTPASVVLVSLMSSRLIVSLWSENYRSSRLSIDSFVTYNHHPPPASFSPKSFHSTRSNKSKTSGSSRNGGGGRRDSDDYDKVGPLEQSIKNAASMILPTLSYNSKNQIPEQHSQRKSASIHSRHGSIISGISEGLPRFDGILIGEGGEGGENERESSSSIRKPVEEIRLEDTRSVKSEGAANRAALGGKSASGRDGTASV
ncbi:hypothetical protein JCM3765_006707 [Sporobolomyces pararoseus]